MKVIPERKLRFEFSECGLPSFPGLDPDDFAAEIKRVPVAERMAMIRSWVQERSPAAFSGSPYLWEAVREWIAGRHGLSASQIGLAGSAQLGFSTNPRKVLAPFDGNGSDLDLYIVSDSLFFDLKSEADIFISRQKSARRSDFMAQANAMEKSLGRGYLDLRNITANHERYPRSASLKNDASIVIDKLRLSGFNLKPSHFRVYRDWKSKESWTKLQAESWVKSLNSSA